MEQHPTASSTTEFPDALQQLELPSLKPRGLIKHFGPGLILMMTGIGTSHLVTAPVAGGRFEYALLWCIPVAYVFKYYGFEMAFRFTNATGKSMLDAYGTAWKRWPLWYVLGTTLLQCMIGQAGRLVATAAVAFYLFSEMLGVMIPLAVYGTVLGVLSVAIILGGRYGAMETVTKVLAGILCISTLAVYVVEPAPLSAMGHFFVVETPGGSWLVIAAFLGLLPTGIDVSLQASEWGKAKRVGMGRIRESLEGIGAAKAVDPFRAKKEDLSVDTSRIPPHAMEYCRRWFQIGLWDFRIGHLVSFLIACAFLLLAATWLYPSDVAGNDVMGEIAQIFTLSVGPWMMTIFLLGAFAATFSTAFNYFDGWPRVVGACCRNLFQGTDRLRGVSRDELTEEHRRTWYSEYNIYRATMFFSLAASIVIVAGVPRPVFLVLVASALALFVAPVVFFLNLRYCLAVIPKEDKRLYPSTFETWAAWGSLVVFTGLTAITILATVFRVDFFLG